MTLSPDTTRIATTASRRRRSPRTASSSMNRHTRSRATAQPLYEALAVGLGCTAVGHRLSPHPEWR